MASFDYEEIKKNYLNAFKKTAFGFKKIPGQRKKVPMNSAEIAEHWIELNSRAAGEFLGCMPERSKHPHISEKDLQNLLKSWLYQFKRVVAKNLSEMSARSKDAGPNSPVNGKPGDQARAVWNALLPPVCHKLAQAGMHEAAYGLLSASGTLGYSLGWAAKHSPKAFEKLCRELPRALAWRHWQSPVTYRDILVDDRLLAITPENPGAISAGDRARIGMLAMKSLNKSCTAMERPYVSPENGLADTVRLFVGMAGETPEILQQAANICAACLPLVNHQRTVDPNAGNQSYYISLNEKNKKALADLGALSQELKAKGYLPEPAALATAAAASYASSDLAETFQRMSALAPLGLLANQGKGVSMIHGLLAEFASYYEDVERNGMEAKSPYDHNPVRKAGGIAKHFAMLEANMPFGLPADEEAKKSLIIKAMQINAELGNAVLDKYGAGVDLTKGGVFAKIVKKCLSAIQSEKNRYYHYGNRDQIVSNLNKALSDRMQMLTEKGVGTQMHSTTASRVSDQAGSAIENIQLDNALARQAKKNPKKADAQAPAKPRSRL